MLLIKYFRYEYGLDVLCNLRIFAGNPNLFNDPHELLPQITKPIFSEFRKSLRSSQYKEEFYRGYKKHRNPNINKVALKQIQPLDIYNQCFSDDLITFQNKNIINLKNKILKWLRIISFSYGELDCKDDMQLWSRYAADYSGFRITFDTDKLANRNIKDGDFQSVIYQNERINIGAHIIHVEKAIPRHQYANLSKIFLVKSTAWAYEHECRLLVKLDRYPPAHFSDNSREYIKCPPEAIVRIDIGHSVVDKHADEVKTLAKTTAFKHIELNKCKLLNESKINYERLL